MTEIKVTQEDVELAESIISGARGFGVKIGRDHSAAIAVARHRIAQIERDAVIAKAEFKGHHFETAAVVIESKILEQLK
jgi:hypothetical protein